MCWRLVLSLRGYAAQGQGSSSSLGIPPNLISRTQDTMVKPEANSVTDPVLGPTPSKFRRESYPVAGVAGYHITEGSQRTVGRIVTVRRGLELRFPSYLVSPGISFLPF